MEIALLGKKRIRHWFKELLGLTDEIKQTKCQMFWNKMLLIFLSI